MIQDIKEVLDYDKESGIFTWLVTVSSHATKGMIAGTIMPKGYRCIRFRGKHYLAHRLAWWWVNGECPKELDHIDKCKDNNSIVNLRECTRSQNNMNKDSKNVTLHKPSCLYRVQIMKGGKMVYSKYFKDEGEAIIHAKEMKPVYHGEFA